MRIVVVSNGWTKLGANANVSFVVSGPFGVEIGIGTDSTPPAFGFTYPPGFGDRGALAEIFPESSGDTLWGFSSSNTIVKFG